MTVAEKRVRGSRGKKNKGSKDESSNGKQQDSSTKTFQRKEYHSTEVGDESGRPARPDRREQIDNAAIFGFIDPDVQQYFKGVEKTLDEQNFEDVEGMHIWLFLAIATRVVSTGILLYPGQFVKVPALPLLVANTPNRTTTLPGECVH